MDANNKLAWQHSNVYAAGKLLATYDADGLHFYLDDPLGSRRVQTDYAGVVKQSCASLPFGDNLACSGSTQYPTEHHFTGKERDAESGLDYFGARYYASSLARFMSPDWSAKIEPVPYSKLDDPQTLNLYAYVQNNPLASVDPDGHGDLEAGGQQTWLDEHQSETENRWKDPVQCICEDAPKNADGSPQQNNNSSSSGHGFWSHVSNLFHGHSWNYGMRESVTVTILPSEPIPAVTAATDAAGIVGLASETAGKVLGPAGAAVSIANDRSHQNVITNVLSLVPGFEGMGVVGAFNDFLDYGANHSHPGPQKVGDPSVPSELQPTLPTQDGGCLAAGGDPC